MDGFLFFAAALLVLTHVAGFCFGYAAALRSQIRFIKRGRK